MRRLSVFASVIHGGFGLILVVLGLGGCAQSGRSNACNPACPGAFECCETPRGPACIDLFNDRDHCGGCGTMCPAGMGCMLGRCVSVSGDGGLPGGSDGGFTQTDGGGGGAMCSPMCPDTMRCCGGRCVARSTTLGSDGRSHESFMNCNGCGIACDPVRASACSVPGGGTGAPRCMCGVFDQCAPGQSCVRDPMTGEFACTSTSTDPNNCGMVGRRCPEGHSCVGGECMCGTGPACSGGRACCDGSCVDTTSDSRHCGRCGNVCGEGLSCQRGECVCGSGAGARACAMPTASSPGELCCGGTCVRQDERNCGSCGTTCDAAEGESCVYGTDVFGGGTMRWCCGMGLLPGLPGFCTMGAGLPDAGFGFPDAGLPFP